MASTLVENEVQAPPTFQPRPWLAVASLSGREFIRFVRQPNRLVGAIGQPILFWFLFGAGLGPSFQLPADTAKVLSYREYFFPGTLVLILLFTAIFATISIIEDRREGFLQSVLVAPIPRWSMVLGKLLGGTSIAMAQAMLFLILGLTLGLHFSIVSLIATVVFMGVVALALTALGFLIAWRMDSTQGFHAIMSVFLLPMWLLSGAFFPPGDNWLGWIIRLNPLTYAVAGLRHLIYWEAPPAVRETVLGHTPSALICMAVTLVFTLVVFMLAWLVAAGRTTGDLL